MLWTEIISGQFEKAVEESKGVCGLVVGCTEVHGRHLPLGQDTIAASGVAELAAKKEPIVLFPPLYFGEKSGAGEFPGTIILSQPLLFDLLTECCREIARNGFKKIILINGHGGNGNLLGNFARSVLQAKNDYMVFCYHDNVPTAKEIITNIDNGKRELYPHLLDEDVELIRNYRKNCTDHGHGCLFETAVTLALRPDLVDLSKVNEVSGESTHIMDHLSKAGLSTPLGWMASYPNSYTSNCHDGNNERIAKTALDIQVGKMANAFKVLKEDTVCEEYLKQWLAKQK